MRLTKHRKEIIATLEKSHGALSASTIHKLLPAIDQVTIYRNLDLFVAEGIIKKLHLDGNEATYEYQAHPHHHAVCSDCKKVIHFDAPDEKIKALLGLKEFSITGLELTVRGTCKHAQ